MPYDVSQMRAHLAEILKNISDLTTTPEDVERYTALNSSLYEIDALTRFFYTPQPDGSFPVLKPSDRQLLTQAYEQAQQRAAAILTEKATGRTQRQMKSVVRELVPLLQSDLSAFQMTDPTIPVTLPELISRARAQAVDMGDAKLPVQSGQASVRQHIRVTNGDTIEEGFFTPSVYSTPKKDFAELMERLEKKYPAYKSFLDAIRAARMEDLCDRAMDVLDTPYFSLEGDDIERDQKVFWRQYHHDMLEISPAIYRPLEDREDYLAFMDEFAQGMTPVRKQYRLYVQGENGLTLQEGANIDKRNIATSRMAGLLGKKELVAEARPMLLIQNGTAVSGTFMAMAEGVDLAHPKPDDPIQSLTIENMDNPAVFGDIAAMQALDFICGNVDRHPGNFFLRFQPKNGPEAKLVGITLIDNDLSFSNAKKGMGSKFVVPEDMGVIGEDVYTAMKLITSEEELRLRLADCGLSDDEIHLAWERKQALEAKIEADKTYFDSLQDKEPGYTEPGRIRLVKQEEWRNYKLADLVKNHPESQFKVISDAKAASESLTSQYEQAAQRVQDNEIKRQWLELPPIQSPEVNLGPAPLGVVTGSGIRQEPDPLNVHREETIKLAVTGYGGARGESGANNTRIPLSWREGNQTRRGYFTPATTISIRRAMERQFDKYAALYPDYADVIQDLKQHYRGDSFLNMNLPRYPNELDFAGMGYSQERIKELKADPAFQNAYSSLYGDLYLGVGELELKQEGAVPGQRVDLKNVAMSEVADVLGTGNLLARSRTAQVEADGVIIDGVIMEEAEGVDPNKIRLGDGGVGSIHPDQENEVYNTAEGLKSLADLAVLDYICLNQDRHPGNIFLKFDGLGTPNPRFKGVHGIDNDDAFQAKVPKPDETVGQLAPLKTMEVISEEMYQHISNPKTAEALAEKMRKNGLSQEQIDAARQRMEQVRQRVESGQIRRVKQHEWATGENTFEKLAVRNKNNFFSYFKGRVTSYWSESYRDKYLNVPEAEREAQAPVPKTKFVRSAKVDAFGAASLENKEYLALRKAAEEDFRKRMSNTVEQLPDLATASELEMLDTIKISSKNMSELLNAADPWNHASSGTYKTLKKRVKELHSLSVSLHKKLTKREKPVLSAKEQAQLTQKLNAVRDQSAAYQMKKERERRQGNTPSDIGEFRIQMAEHSGKAAGQLQNTLESSIAARQAQRNPSRYAHQQLQGAQKALTALKGDALRQKVAEVIYLKGLTMTDIQTKLGPKMRKAILPEVVKQNTESIQELPAFQKLSGMKDEELRTLASGEKCDQLMDRFYRDQAESVQEERQQQQRQQAIEKANRQQPAAQANPDLVQQKVP